MRQKATYADLADATCALMGWQADDLDERQYRLLRRAVTEATRTVWNAWWWQELMICRPVLLAPEFELFGLYNAGDTLYDAASNWYYTALTLTSTAPVSDGVVNYAAWAVAAEKQSGETFDPQRSYAPGDRVRYAGLVYQCITAASAADWVSNAVNFLPVPDWDPTIAYADASRPPVGEVRAVTPLDPRRHAASHPYLWQADAAGIHLFSVECPRPWIWYLPPPPEFDGDPWSATASYSAADPMDQIFYDAVPPGYVADPVISSATGMSLGPGRRVVLQSADGTARVELYVHTDGTPQLDVVSDTTPLATVDGWDNAGSRLIFAPGHRLVLQSAAGTDWVELACDNSTGTPQLAQVSVTGQNTPLALVQGFDLSGRYILPPGRSLTLVDRGNHWAGTYECGAGGILDFTSKLVTNIL